MRSSDRSRPTRATAMWRRTGRSITPCLREPLARHSGAMLGIAPGIAPACKRTQASPAIPGSMLRIARGMTRSSAMALSRLRGIAMHGVDPQLRLRLLDRLDADVDSHRLAVGAHQHAFQHLVATGIDLLMRNIRRHEDE